MLRLGIVVVAAAGMTFASGIGHTRALGICTAFVGSGALAVANQPVVDSTAEQPGPGPGPGQVCLLFAALLTLLGLMPRSGRGRPHRVPRWLAARRPPPASRLPEPPSLAFLQVLRR